MKRDNYITIQGWMVSELGLSGNELILYALIYGFSQDGETSFSGSLSYICKWLNVTKPTAINLLKSLVEKGVIVKEENIINSIKFCKYRSFNGGKETLPVVNILSENEPLGGKETLPNNTISNIYNRDMSEITNQKESDRKLSESVNEIPPNNQKERKEKSSAKREKKEDGIPDVWNPKLNQNLSLNENIRIAVSFWALFKHKKEQLGIKPTVLYKAKPDKWEKEVLGLIEKDGRTIQEVREIYVYLLKFNTREAAFWGKTIQSITNLREHFERIQMAYLEDKKALNENTSKRVQSEEQKQSNVRYLS